MQIVLQRLRPRHHVGHGVVLAGAFFFDPGARRPRAFLEMIGELFVHVEQPLEVVLVVLVFVDNQLALFFGGSVGVLDVERFVGQVAIFFGQVQDRVLLDLLLDALLQRHDGQLQDLHRLDHARCQHLLLNQS